MKKQKQKYNTWNLLKESCIMTQQRKHERKLLVASMLIICVCVGTSTIGVATQLMLSEINSFDYTTIYVVKKEDKRAVAKTKAEKITSIETPEKRFYSLLDESDAFRNYIDNLNVKRFNPGNLRCNSQPHSTCENGFAKFPNKIIGFRALIKQLELDQSRNLSLEDFLYKYSPPTENSTEHLIWRASHELGIERQELINYLDTIQLAVYMTNQEHSIPMIDL